MVKQYKIVIKLNLLMLLTTITSLTYCKGGPMGISTRE